MFALTLAVATLSVAVAPVGAVGSIPEGEPPLADAGLDQHVSAGTTVTLEAIRSRDPDGELVGYSWRVETRDGRTTTPTPPNRGQTRFTVTQPGRYAVTVTVRDDDGNTVSDTLYVAVDGTATPTTTTPIPTPGRRATTPAPPVPTATPKPPAPATGSGPTSPSVTGGGPLSGPTASVGPASGPPTPPGPDCVESFGPTCIDPPDCTDSDLASECIRTVRVEGPDTLAEGEPGEEERGGRRETSVPPVLAGRDVIGHGGWGARAATRCSL
jgi:hypothetical protein